MMNSLAPFVTGNVRYSILFLLLIGSFSIYVNAEDKVSLATLSSDDFDRLGLIFEQVSAVSQENGSKVPALVINSPEKNTSVVSSFTGILQEWLANSGANVTAATPLATLFSADLMSAQKSWLAAYNALEQAQYELNKDEQLFQEGIIARQRLDQSKRKLQHARFSLRGEQQQLEQAGFTQQELDALLAGTLTPGKIVLKSPAGGILSRRLFNVGEVVPARQVVAEVSGAKQLWAESNLPVALAQHLSVGDTLLFVPDNTVNSSITNAFENTNITLTLKNKDAEVSSSTQLLAISAAFNEPCNCIAGQQITLTIPPVAEGIFVPASAVTHNGTHTQVYVKAENGIRPQNVQLIPMGSSYIATEGLESGDQIVTSGAAILKGIELGLGGGE